MAVSPSFLNYKLDSDDLDDHYSKSSEYISFSDDEEDDSDDDDSDDNDSSDDSEYDDDSDDDDSDDDDDLDDDSSSDDSDDDDDLDDDSSSDDSNDDYSRYSGFSVVEQKSDADTITNFNASKDKIKLSFDFDDDIDFKFTDSRREFRQASSRKFEIIFNDKNDGLYFNDNGRRDGLGEDGGLIALIVNLTGRLSDDNFIT
ncbi:MULTISPECIES: hypothetical protein [unclassified Cyanobium]|uniref:hypothetical protein n=1 Tax=unclassified Cyanobium TaxID=2627006 RepID=UPI0020CC49AB|nr:MULTISPECIES: hypothetical protein [unclassified Cyanobium]MCP9778932.1 hypothetical protein [Cyanobium sp. Tous-M-B4]MCP9877572.1 hypothetical protein [Cyanobium sp. A2C-AMD]